jgi:hypothetical protein
VGPRAGLDVPASHLAISQVWCPHTSVGDRTLSHRGQYGWSGHVEVSMSLFNQKMGRTQLAVKLCPLLHILAEIAQWYSAGLRAG